MIIPELNIFHEFFTEWQGQSLFSLRFFLCFFLRKLFIKTRFRELFVPNVAAVTNSYKNEVTNLKNYKRFQFSNGIFQNNIK